MRRSAKSLLLLLLTLVPLVAPTGCAGFEPLLDRGPGPRDAAIDRPAAPEAGPVDRGPADIGGAGADGDAPPSGCSGPGAGRPPQIDGFEITDGITRVVLEQPVSLVARAQPAIAGEPLTYRFTVSPGPTDPVVDNGDGTARWALTSAPPAFFTTRFEITVEVTHACGGPAAKATVGVDVAGNLLLANHEQGAIEAVGSNGKWLGQLVGPSVLTSPSDMVLLGNSGELAVGDTGPDLVKVIDLATKKVTRTIGGAVDGLVPWFLERDGGGLLVAPVEKNKVARFDAQGKLVGLLEPPHPYGMSGLARRADGSVIIGTSGIGRLYAFSPAGESLGLWAEVPAGSDTNSLLAVTGDELLAGLRGPMNDGLLARLTADGAVAQTLDGAAIIPGDNRTFYYLAPFLDGYVHAELKDRRLWLIDAKLTPSTAPLVNLPAGVWPMGIVWLDAQP